MHHIKIFLKPHSKIDQIEKKGDIFHIKIKAKPIDNAANLYLIDFLSKYFKIPKTKIFLLKGHTSRHKIIGIEDEA